MNLKFKSSEPDLKFNIQLQLRQINDNILYLTREVDKLVRMQNQTKVNKGLQLQVDKYFEENQAVDNQSDTGEAYLGINPEDKQDLD